MPEQSSLSATATVPLTDGRRWYSGVTGYQWLVLVIASAGWIFDTFEGQLFNITRQEMLRELAGNDPQRLKFWGDFFLGVFLAGGAVGGVAFGSLADRIGRKPVMAITILFYSLFSGLTFLVTSLWHVAALRFLVAMGVGGEWAVAAALVCEIFPQRARARAGAIFHASSVLGTLGAALTGMLVGVHWRHAYLVSALPALLLFAVQTGVREPERRQQADAGRVQPGSFRELFEDARWRPRAIYGLLLAAVGLGTFWGVVVAGQDLTRELLLRAGCDPLRAAQQAKFAYGVIETLGMGCGLISFGPMAERLGRRRAFLLMHLCALGIVPVTCYLPHTYGQMLTVLPIFGFFTGGMHAGYAIYFPEMFPDHLRATGAAVCFNGGRIVAAPMVWISAAIKSWPRVDLRLAIVVLSLLYLFGAVLLLFLPETKDQPLPRE
ncbi:MAG: major facilitator superfamily 1 [Phycisphaerales bacterium]|nr:major facilitator superfamily 1 [Phycisphaerales bacterium]